MRGELHGQIGLGQHHIPHEVGHRHFAGGNQIQRRGLARILPAFVGGEQVFFKLGQLPGSAQGIGVDDVRRVALGVAVLLRLHFQHELRQRPVQPRHGALHHAESRASEFDAHIKVQAQRCAHVHMVFDPKVKYPRCAPAAGHHVAVFIAAARHAGVRQVGYSQEHGLHVALDLLQLRRAVFQFGFDVGGLRHHGVHFCGTRSAFGFELADLLAQGIAPGLQFFGAGLYGFALGFQTGEAGQVQKGLR